MRDDRERLRDVLEAIERIEKYAVRGQQALASEDLLQTWVVHHLMIIGEACRALSPDFRTKYPAEVIPTFVHLRTQRTAVPSARPLPARTEVAPSSPVKNRENTGAEGVLVRSVDGVFSCDDVVDSF